MSIKIIGAIILVLIGFAAGLSVASSPAADQVQADLNNLEELDDKLLVTEFEDPAVEETVLEIANPEEGMLICTQRENYEDDPDVMGIYSCSFHEDRTHPLLQ